MKIRTQVIISVILFAAILITLATSLIVVNSRITRFSQQELTVNQVERLARELGYTANSYLLYGESQLRDRWESTFDELSTDLSNLNEAGPEEQVVVDNIKTNLASLRTIFTDVSAAIERNSQTPGGFFDRSFIQVSWSRIEVQNQAVVFDASRLFRILDSRLNQARQRSTTLLFVLVIVFAVYIFSTYLLVFRRTLKSLSELSEGARVIGSGNLDYTVPEKHKDEVGDLSRAFNRMTTELKTVTASKANLGKEIRERKRAEQSLKEAKEQLSLAMDSAGLGTFDYDLKNEVVHWDERTKRMCGIPGGNDPTYEEAARFLHPDDRQRVETILAKAFAPAADGTYEAEFRIVRPDGSVIWNRAMGRVYFEGEGTARKAVRQIGINQDITERKKAEEALLQTKELAEADRSRFEGLLMTSPSAIVVIENPDGRISFINERAT